MIAIEGSFNGQPEPAVVVIEKYAFDEDSVLNVCNGQTTLKTNIKNDVYSSFSCVPPYNGRNIQYLHAIIYNKILLFVLHTY